MVDLDADMKIVPDKEPEPKVDAEEIAAQEFLRQRELGNIDRARELGAYYAKGLLEPHGPLADALKDKDPAIQHQQYLLYSYVVNRVITDLSPNSILAQAALSRFYNDVEDTSPELYRHINDMAAFSLYILHNRAKANSDEEIGTVFAGLCGCEIDKELSECGSAMFRQLYAYCAEQMKKTNYRD